MVLCSLIPIPVIDTEISNLLTINQSWISQNVIFYLALFISPVYIMAMKSTHIANRLLGPLFLTLIS